MRFCRVPPFAPGVLGLAAGRAGGPDSKESTAAPGTLKMTYRNRRKKLPIRHKLHTKKIENNVVLHYLDKSR